MNKLQAIIRYLCIHYPYKSELSNARVTKMVYLADWFSARKSRAQLTDIRWLFDHYGPYVPDVSTAASNDPAIRVEQTSNFYGSPKIQLHFVGNPFDELDLSAQEKDILNEVMTVTSPLAFKAFIDYVYGTYPVRSATRYSILDLPQLAQAESEHIR